MQRSIYLKLTLVIMLVALITAALMSVFIRISNTDRLYRLVVEQQREVVQQALSDYYQQVGSWNGIQRYWGQILRLSAFVEARNMPEITGPGDPIPIRAMDRNLFGLADRNGNWIIPVEQDEQVGQEVARKYLRDDIPITAGGETVGVLLTARKLSVYNPAEVEFLARTNRALIVAVAIALGVALLVGLLLAGSLTRPLRALTRAAEGVAAGDLEQQVDVTSNDEIGQLAESFNRMSQQVARSNQLRRQMTADVAHDLRTPLTVIGGYVESMRDGVLPPTPERLALIYTEIERLQGLVGDLQVISKADSGELRLNLRPVHIGMLLERTAGIFQLRAEQQQVNLSVRAEEGLPALLLDEDRMMQVMDNLLANALRYTPPGGEITLAARRADADETIQIQVIDSGAGISSEELPHVFERFHRGDVSRHSESGESGLGLAIVKAIVEVHGGKVWAESTPGQGTAVSILLPYGPQAA